VGFFGKELGISSFRNQKKVMRGKLTIALEEAGRYVIKVAVIRSAVNATNW